MKLSAKGLALLKQFEGCKLAAYQDGRGVWTIGYGHTGASQPGSVKDGLQISQHQADVVLCFDVEAIEDAISHALPQFLNTNQYDALVCLAFNIGPSAFLKSTLLKELKLGHVDVAAAEFLKWRTSAGHVVAGLIARRASEKRLFQTPIQGQTPIPTLT